MLKRKSICLRCEIWKKFPKEGKTKKKCPKKRDKEIALEGDSTIINLLA
jgi:hypothetical protein